MSEMVVTRVNAFDFFRLFAAVVVVFAHVNASFGTAVGSGVVSLFDGVAIFFVLSGMLVWSSADKLAQRGVKWRWFFFNRYLRIAPALYVFAALSLAVMLVVGAVPFGGLVTLQTVVWFGSFAFLLPNFTPSFLPSPEWSSINNQLWTIPAEVSFYLVVPALMLMARRIGVLPVAVGLAALSMGARFAAVELGGPAVDVVHHTFLELGPYFAVGMVLARYGSRIPLRWWLGVPAALVQSALLVYGNAEPFSAVFGPWKPLLLAVPLAYALFYFGLRLGPLLTNLTAKIGDLSFGVYVWHYAVAAVFVTLGWSGDALATVSVAVVSLLVAAASWFFVEKPCLGLKKHALRAVTPRRLGLRGAER